MVISSIEINNFKGFRASGKIKLTSGFNVVVGQNNVGKTALLEALTLQVSNKPHRSPETIPYQGAPHPNASTFELTFAVEGSELASLLKGFKNFWLPTRYVGNSALGLLKETLASNQTLHCRIKENKFEVANFDCDGQGTFVGTATDASFNHANNSFQASGQSQKVQLNSLYGFAVAEELRRRLYYFRAQRFSHSQSGINTETVLAADAANLASVLHLLQSNPARFQRFNENVRTILPDIQQITTKPINQNAVQINVWTINPETQREDLAFPLSECGTGIGQILGILYVVMTAEHPKTIIIDEPQSFLHPGAIRKLFEILKRYPQHQYIISTHSPTVVTAANPNTVVMLRRHGSETKPEVLNFPETREMRAFLSEVGARLSDVFGADNILWVEGQTEEVCFPRIVDKILKTELLGTEILGVKQVGDLEGKHAKTILEIYQRLCKGRGLLPPALAFSFDREKRTEAELDQLSKDSGGLIHFIPRHTFENYLLNPKAITAVLADADKENGAGVSEEAVTKWIGENGQKTDYYNSKQGEWIKAVHGAKLLGDLFASLSETRVVYDKVKHGIKLTDWIVQNAPSDLDELAAYLKVLLKTEAR